LGRIGELVIIVPGVRNPDVDMRIAGVHHLADGHEWYFSRAAPFIHDRLDRPLSGALTSFLPIRADPRLTMGKVISAAVAALVALVLTDQHFYSGRYTDAMLAALRQIQHSFG
jgi:hypothetical protein